jgi:hypothetical protein
LSIDSNIIFIFGSKLGPGGFASLKAGIDMLGQMYNSVKDNIAELDKFAQSWQRANKEAVIAADTAAAGLIDTGEIIKQHNALMHAGVKITDQQFRTIAVRSVEMAKATGQDATQAFQRLTKSIQTGSTRALREYGVDLRTSGTLTQKQTEAVNKLTKGFDNMSVSADTASEQLFALENNLGTFYSLLWDATGRNETFSNSLDSLNSALGEFNTLLAEAPDAMSDFIFSAENLKGIFSEVGDVIVESIMEPFIEIERWINEKFGIKGAGVLEQWVSELRRTYADISRGVWEEQMTRVDQEVAETGGLGRAPTGGLPRGRGGGGEAAGPDFQQQFLEEDLEMRRMIEERIIADHEMRQEIRAAEEEAEMLALQNSTERQEEYLNYLDELEEQAHWRKLTRFETMMGVEQKYIAASSKQWASGLQGKAEMMGMFFGSVAQLMNTESEKMFKIGKAAAIAEGLINTFLGAIKAYQSFAGLGPWGVAMGAIAAAAVTAAGLANVAKIKQQKFQGGGSGAGAATTASNISRNIGSAGGIGAGIPSGAVPAGAAAQAQREQKVTVNIVMRDGGLGLFDVVMDQNESAGKDGRRYFATTGL